MSNYRNISLERLCAAFGALSNPHRLRIFLRLTACCPPGAAREADAACCVGELGAELGVAPSTVSHHIKELERCGLIHMTRRGRNIICQADGDAVSALRRFFDRPLAPENHTP
ncbi:MAG: winged helix-turn-helix transcriptional regulator [Nitrospirae bacterium]|nr:winged helix-turn-helix transcriptional regulator [Nitrospirota bacterium]